MELHYQGKYNLDPETLPKRKHQPNAVKFKEVSSSKELAVIANTIGLVLMVILSIPILLVYKNDLLLYFDYVMLAVVFPILTMFPHELLHALCFKEDVYLYTNFKQGMVFVLGTETMSKKIYFYVSSTKFSFWFSSLLLIFSRN